VLDGSSFFRTVKKGRRMVFKPSLYDINTAIDSKDFKEQTLEEMVPKQYHEFLRLFNTVLADRLPPYRPVLDDEVPLTEG